MHLNPTLQDSGIPQRPRAPPPPAPVSSSRMKIATPVSSAMKWMSAWPNRRTPWELLQRVQALPPWDPGLFTIWNLRVPGINGNELETILNSFTDYDITFMCPGTFSPRVLTSAPPHPTEKHFKR